MSMDGGSRPYAALDAHLNLYQGGVLSSQLIFLMYWRTKLDKRYLFTRSHECQKTLECRQDSAGPVTQKVTVAAGAGNLQGPSQPPRTLPDPGPTFGPLFLHANITA